MERLIYSNSIPSKFHLKHIPFLPQPARLSISIPHFNKLSSFRPGCSRLSSLSCNYQDPSANSSAIFSKSADTTDHRTSPVDLPDGSTEKVNFLRKAVESLTQQQK